MNDTDKAETGEGKASRVNDPNANYAMYELDRVAKREAQTIEMPKKASGSQKLPGVKEIMERTHWEPLLGDVTDAQCEEATEAYYGKPELPQTMQEMIKRLEAYGLTVAQAPNIEEGATLGALVEKHEAQHEFKPSETLSRGASHALCSDCGLSEQAATHKPRWNKPGQAQLRKENAAAHSPLPWRKFTRYVMCEGRFLATAHTIGDSGSASKGFAKGQEPTQTMNEAEANAKLIVRAVNHAEKLAEAVEQFVRYADNGKHPEWADYMLTIAGDKMRAALNAWRASK